MQNSRRSLLIGIAGAGALVAADDHIHVHEEQSSPAVAYTPQVFTPTELAIVGALCETIIPKTSTPGALDAKVHELIDESLVPRKAVLVEWQMGLSEVDAIAKKRFRKGYLELNDADRVAVMTDLAAASKFFKVLKDATVDQYYSTREGLMTELGWDGAKPMAKFEGCTHPEHKA